MCVYAHARSVNVLLLKAMILKLLGLGNLFNLENHWRPQRAFVDFELYLLTCAIFEIKTMKHFKYLFINSFKIM